MKKLLMLIGIGLRFQLLMAQTDLPPLIASGQYENDFYKWSFSMGDLAIWTFPAPGQYWSQGSQQPEITVVGTNEPEQTISWDAILFPNPTSDWLYCKIDRNEPDQNFRLLLLDGLGRTIQSFDASVTAGDPIAISTSKLAAGRYDLRIIALASGAERTKTFIKSLN
jgi:hypothetical protein